MLDCCCAMGAFYFLLVFYFIGASCNASSSSVDDTTEELEYFSKATLVASFNEMGTRYTEGFLEIFPEHRIFTQQQTTANEPDPLLKKAEELFTRPFSRPLASDVKNSIAKLLKALPEELWGSVSSYVMQRPKLINSRYFESLLHIAQSVKLEKDSITTFLFGVEKSFAAY